MICFLLPSTSIGKKQIFTKNLNRPAQWAAQYLAPYLCFSWWLFTVMYLQHHDEDTKTYEEGEWEYVLGGLETIDREFGFGVDEMTHHITDCHVAHHMFSDMPHYRLPLATAGVRGVLEVEYLSALYLKE